MIRVNRKGLLCYYAVMVILMLGLLGNRHRDYIEKEYYNYPDYPELNNIAVNADYQTAYDQGTDYNGNVTGGPDITLPKGSYEIEFWYRSEAEGNRFVVKSSTEVGADNQLGCTYLNGELPLNDDGRCTVSFEMEESVGHMQVETYTEQGDLFLYGYTIRSTEPVNNDAWARAAVILFAFLLFHMFCMRMDKDAAEWYEVTEAERLGAVLAVVLVGLVASFPCFTDFVTEGHDLDYHLTRIEGLKEALSCGQFPVRINPEFANGYGQANPIMYPELFLYFPALLRICGVSLILSYKLLCIGLNLACAWAGYISFRKLMNSRTLGVLVSALYTLSLYRMNNLYMRAALGEWIGMVFLPLVIYGMYALFYEEKKKWGWSVLGFTLCLQGHLLITEMAVAFSCLFAVLAWKQLKDKSRLFTVIMAGAVTVLLNLWYIVPLLYFYTKDMGIASEKQPLGQYALYPGQLFTTFLYNGNMGEFLGSTAGENPSTVGGILGIGMLLYLYAAYVRKSLTVKEKKIGNTMLGFGVLSLYMTTCYFPWDLLQEVQIIDFLAGILQFPLRILSVASLFLSAVCALGIYGVCKGRMANRTVVLLGVVLAIVASAYTLDSYVEQNKTKLADDTDSYNKNLIYNGLLYFQGTDCNALLNRPAVAVASSEAITLQNFHKEGTTISLQYANHTKEEGYVELPLYYYPGYCAWDNGTEISVSAGENGIVRVYLDGESEGEILVEYKEKSIFVWCDMLSIAGLAGICASEIYRRRKYGTL